MAAYIHIETQEYPLYPGDMQLRYPNFDEQNPPDGYAVVPELDPPEWADTQYFIELAPILINGVWVKQYRIVDYTQEELDAQAALEKASRNAARGILNTDQPGSAPNVIE